jgi:transposase
MESGIKCAQPETLAFKPAVFEQVEKGELTYTDAQRRYGIQDEIKSNVVFGKFGLIRRQAVAEPVCCRSPVARL